MSYYAEIFDRVHSHQDNPHLSPSLLSFLKNEVTPYLERNKISLENILEIGCGTQSLFEVWPNVFYEINKTAIDCSKVAIYKNKNLHPNSKTTYLVADITNKALLSFPNGELSNLIPQDLVLDGHAYHFIKDQEHRNIGLRNTRNLLKSGGLFVGEMAIRTNSMQTSDAFHLPYAHEIENELLQNGFMIKMFIIRPGLHLETLERGMIERFEVVSFIAEKCALI